MSQSKRADANSLNIDVLKDVIDLAKDPESAIVCGGYLEDHPSAIEPFLGTVYARQGISKVLTCTAKLFAVFGGGSEVGSNSGICGKLWKPGDPAYKCITCEADPTCALCIPCFKNGNHEGHDYRLITTGGGCCDCGDPEAWNSQGFCKYHRGPPDLDEDPTEGFSLSSREIMKNTFDFLLKVAISCIISAGADYSLDEEAVAASEKGKEEEIGGNVMEIEEASFTSFSAAEEENNVESTREPPVTVHTPSAPPPPASQQERYFCNECSRYFQSHEPITCEFCESEFIQEVALGESMSESSEENSSQSLNEESGEGSEEEFMDLLHTDSESERSDLVTFDGLAAGGHTITIVGGDGEQVTMPIVDDEEDEEIGIEQFRNFIQNLFPHGIADLPGLNDLMATADGIFHDGGARNPLAGVMRLVPRLMPNREETDQKERRKALAILVSLRATVEKSQALQRLLSQVLVGPTLSRPNGFELFKKPKNKSFGTHPLLAQLMIVNDEIGFRIFKNDKHLGESITKLIFKLNGDFWFKTRFALVFVLYYNDCFKHSLERLIADKRPDFDNDIQGFSVQILTIQSIVPDLVRNHGLLSQLLKSMHVSLQRALNTRNIVDANNVVVKQRLYFRVAHDIEYAVLQKCISHYLVRENPEIIADWVKLLRLLQGMSPNVRAITEHVAFEDTSFRYSHQLELDLMKPTPSIFLAFEDRWSSEELGVGVKEVPVGVSVSSDLLKIARVLNIFLKNLLEDRVCKKQSHSTVWVPPLFNTTQMIESGLFRSSTESMSDLPTHMSLPLTNVARDSVSFHCPLTRATVYGIAIANSNPEERNFALEDVLVPLEWNEGLNELAEFVTLLEEVKNEFGMRKGFLNSTTKLKEEVKSDNPLKKRKIGTSMGDKKEVRKQLLNLIGIALLDDPLTERVLDGQIRCGMWSRNGFNMRTQLKVIEFVGIRNRVIDLDIASLQIATCLVGADSVIMTMLSRFGLCEHLSLPAIFPFHDGDSKEYHTALKNYEKAVGEQGKPSEEMLSEMMEYFLKLLIQIISERAVIGDFIQTAYNVPSEFDSRNPHHKDSGEPERARLRRLSLLRYELLHRLVISESTHSELKNCTTVGLSKDESELASVLESISEYSRSNIDKAGKFKLKESIWSEMNPYYSFYSPAEARNAEERFLSTSPNATFLSLPPPLVPLLPAFSKLTTSFASSRILTRLIYAILQRTHDQVCLGISAKTISDSTFTKTLHLIWRVLEVYNMSRQHALSLLWPFGDSVSDSTHHAFNLPSQPSNSIPGIPVQISAEETISNQSIIGLLLDILKVISGSQVTRDEPSDNAFARKEVFALLKAVLIECGKVLPSDVGQVIMDRITPVTSDDSNGGKIHEVLDSSQTRKELAARRRAAIMAKFQEQQKKFISANEDAKSFIEKDKSIDKESSTSFQCVLCQESSGSTAENPVCYISFLQCTDILKFASLESDDFSLTVNVEPNTSTERVSFARSQETSQRTIYYRNMIGGLDFDSCNGSVRSTFNPKSCLSSSVDDYTSVAALFCGHTVHTTCFERYSQTLKQSHARGADYEGRFSINVLEGEYLCPGCRRPGNALVPVLIRKASDGVDMSEESEGEEEKKEEAEGILCIREHAYEKEVVEPLSDSLNPIDWLLDLQCKSKDSAVTYVPVPYESDVLSNLLERNLCVKNHAASIIEDVGEKDPNRERMIALNGWNTVAMTVAIQEYTTRHESPSLLNSLASSSVPDLSLAWSATQTTQMRSIISSIHDYSWDMLDNDSREEYFQWFISVLLGQKEEKIEDSEVIESTVHPILSMDAFSLLVKHVLAWRGTPPEQEFDKLAKLYYTAAVTQSASSTLNDIYIDRDNFKPDTYCEDLNDNTSIEKAGRILAAVGSSILALFHDSPIYCANYIPGQWDNSAIEFYSELIHTSINYTHFMVRFWKYLLLFVRRLTLFRRLCYNSEFVLSNSLVDLGYDLSLLTADYVSLLLNELHLNVPESLFNLDGSNDWMSSGKVLVPKWIRHFRSMMITRIYKPYYEKPNTIPMHGLIPFTPKLKLFGLLRLPENYLDLYQIYVESRCAKCNTIPSQPGLCLHCGEIICIGGRCCTDRIVQTPGFSYKPVSTDAGEAQLHALLCGAGTSAYIVLKHSGTLLCSNGRTVLWHSLYSDEWGEEDPYLRRGRPIHLNKSQVKALLWLFYHLQIDCEIVNSSLTQNLRVYSHL